MRVSVAKHRNNQTNHQHQLQQTLQHFCCNGNFFLQIKPQSNVKPAVTTVSLHVCVHFHSSDLFLTFDITPSLQHFGKKDVEAFLDGQEDEACHHGAQIIDNVINSLVSKAENVHKGHDISLALCEDLLQEGLLEEAPRELG